MSVSSDSVLYCKVSVTPAMGLLILIALDN